MRKFIDIGANLTDPQFYGIYHNSRKHASDFDAVLGRAKESKVVKMMVTGSSLDESAKALDLCRANPRYLYSTVGVHPCHSSEVPPEPSSYYTQLKELAIKGRQEGHIAAFGEIGLDYDRLHFAPAETQQRVFLDQLKLASQLKLPLFLHSRAASADFCRMVEPFAYLGGVVHSFTGTKKELDEVLKLGFYIGVNGCSLKTQENLEVVKHIPLDRLMLETDGPWCEIRPSHASHPHIRSTLPYPRANKPDKWVAGSMVKGRCEPCSISQVAEVVAFVQGIEVDEVVSAAYENTLRVFFNTEK